jgi:hypothetical protein
MSDVPNICGPGQLFAYSGMDGATCATSPLVAHTLGDRIGLHLFSDPPINLWCQAIRDDDPHRKYPRCMPRFDIVTGDAIRLTVTSTDGQSGRIAFASVDQDTILGETPRYMPLRWTLEPNGDRPIDLGTHIHHLEHGVLVLTVREEDKQIRFALSFDDQEMVRAIAKTHNALDMNIDGLIDIRKRWYTSVDLPAGLPDDLGPTYRKALSVMRVNTCQAEGQIRHRWTTPDRWPHRWMWLHDSAYHSVGHVYHFPDLAKEMLAAVFDTQESDGRIALLMQPDGNFPDISQSPILAWAVRQVFEATGDRDFLAELYPKIKAYLTYFQQTRAFGDTGLHRWLHSDESMDNNPRFDSGSDFGAIDLSSTLCREFEEAAAMAQEVGIGEDARVWTAAREETAKAINRLLWDKATGQYGDLMPDGSVRALSTCVTFLPLFAGIVPPDRAKQLRSLLTDPEKFWRPVPVPTVAADEPTFFPDMWRGPSWININHLISLGLDRSGFRAEADEIRRRSIDVIHKWYRHTGCIYEFYDGDDRVPPFAMDRKSRIAYVGGFTNISDYHWSAALFIAMCQHLYRKP